MHFQFTLDHLWRKVAQYQPENLNGDANVTRHAAVAMVLRESDEGGELLMIRRAEHPQDPWSGQMGFPGGRVDPEDASPFHAALRETREEVGIDLSDTANCRGRLSELHARSAMRMVPLSIFPFVFELSDVVDLTPNHEVAEAVWIPLRFFIAHENRTTMTIDDDGVVCELPCYWHDDRRIWGLSLAMLDELLFEVMAVPQP